MNLNDQSLIPRLEKILEENLENEQFGVEELARAIGISRSHLHRKLSGSSGQSISQFIREFRLRKALDLLREGKHSVSEIAYRVGFGSATYFSRSFTKFYGHPPSQVQGLEQEAPENEPLSKSRERWTRSIPAKWVAAVIVFAILIPYSIFFIVKLSGRSQQSVTSNKSVALLPFENLSDDPVNAYFSAGMGDAIARKLSGISDLRVVSQTALALGGDGRESMVEIANKLNTSYLIEGSVQKFGQAIRVEVGLVNGLTGHRVWAEHFDREFEDIFQVQNEIAEKVALQFETALAPDYQSRINLGYTDNPVAYELYMKAYYEFSSYTRVGYRLAEEYLTEAIELDSNFALAHSLSGNIAFAKGSIFGVELDAQESLSQAIVPILKALEIEPDLPESHALKGYYHLYYDWDFKTAEEEYLLGLERFNTEGYAIYIDYLNFVGRHQEALEMARRMDYNEPYYPNTRMILSLYYNQMIEEAREFAQARLRVMQNYFTLDSYGFLLLNSGDYEEAIEVFHQIFELENVRYPRILGWMGAAYARSGQPGKARELLDELKRHKSRSAAGSPAFFIAVIYAALDETDEALQWLTLAIDEHEMEIPWLISEPQFTQLHETESFHALVRRVGFPESSF